MFTLVHTVFPVRTLDPTTLELLRGATALDGKVGEALSQAAEASTATAGGSMGDSSASPGLLSSPKGSITPYGRLPSAVKNVLQTGFNR